MKSRSLFLSLLLGAVLAAVTPPPAVAWSPALERALFRDAQRLLPRSLALLLRDRERAVLDAAQHPPPGIMDFSGELAAGPLRESTIGAFDAELRAAADMMQHKQ